MNGVRLPAAVLATALALAGCADAGATYTNPVFEPILADPGALRAEDGSFYVYGTEDDWGDGAGSRPVPVLRSTDLVTWEHLGEAFDRRPRWKDGYVWAPEAIRHADRYLLYYAVSVWGDADPGIGVATAEDPAGPFTDEGPLLTSREIGVGNSIDPSVVELAGGARHLVWGSFHGIYVAPLSADGLSLDGEPTRIAGDAWEAVKILERDGVFWLFGSLGSCCEGMASTYRIAVGRADALTGPYTDRDGAELLSGEGTLLLSSGEEFIAPGHHDLVTDDAGDDWLLYHAYERDRPTAPSGAPRRVLMLDRLRWDGGWPAVGDGTPRTGEHPAPTIDDEES